jgi:hypothetical protein
MMTSISPQLYAGGRRNAKAFERTCRNQAFTPACAVCSPKTKVNECNGDLSPVMMPLARPLLGEGVENNIFCWGSSPGIG